jgi:hypothetical protein
MALEFASGAILVPGTKKPQILPQIALITVIYTDQKDSIGTFDL